MNNITYHKTTTATRDAKGRYHNHETAIYGVTIPNTGQPRIMIHNSAILMSLSFNEAHQLIQAMQTIMNNPPTN